MFSFKKVYIWSLTANKLILYFFWCIFPAELPDIICAVYIYIPGVQQGGVCFLYQWSLSSGPTLPVWVSLVCLVLIDLSKLECSERVYSADVNSADVYSADVNSADVNSADVNR